MAVLRILPHSLTRDNIKSTWYSQQKFPAKTCFVTRWEDIHAMHGSSAVRFLPKRRKKKKIRHLPAIHSKCYRSLSNELCLSRKCACRARHWTLQCPPVSPHHSWRRWHVTSVFFFFFAFSSIRGSTVVLCFGATVSVIYDFKFFKGKRMKTEAGKQKNLNSSFNYLKAAFWRW